MFFCKDARPCVSIHHPAMQIDASNTIEKEIQNSDMNKMVAVFVQTHSCASLSILKILSVIVS